MLQFFNINRKNKSFEVKKKNNGKKNSFLSITSKDV